jgi:hypothetical protein
MQELEKRLQALEEIEAIKRLQARYCAMCDAGYDSDGLAGLFTEDAVWDGLNPIGCFWYRRGCGPRPRIPGTR